MSFEQEVRQAIQGDHEAFIRLMRQLEQGLYNTARAIVKKDEDIADAMQETILKTYKSLDTLREPEFFKTWIYRILINECNMILKRRSRTTGMESVPESQVTSEQIDSLELRMAVDKLEDQQRIAVILYYFQDMPIKQVANALQISESAVKTRLYRARKVLLEQFQPVNDGGLNYESI